MTQNWRADLRDGVVASAYVNGGEKYADATAQAFDRMYHLSAALIDVTDIL